jgi:hypothetical protein
MQKHTVEIVENIVDNKGEQLRYLLAGSGPPVLLVHGLLGGSFCWRFNIPSFAQRRTVMALDLPGFGENQAPRHADCSMEAQAIRLAGLLERLKLGQVDGGIVVGRSGGTFSCRPQHKSSFPGAGGAGESMVRLWRGTHTVSERLAGRNTASPDVTGFTASAPHGA